MAALALLRLVAWYRPYEDAQRARHEDVLARLAAGGGWHTWVEYLIVGPGLQGPRTVHRLAIVLGVDSAAGTIPNADDLDDARHWLATIHRTRSSATRR